MAKFLNTSGTTYHLEELIKEARDKLILISPFLKLNDRVKELLEDKNRMKIDVRVVYGKNELHPDEIRWLNGLTFVRTSFCKNLHAKCYLSESACIVTSLNLYEFSQVNNNEMGILIRREEDATLYRDAADEAQRIIRVSDEVRMTLETVAKQDDSAEDEGSSDKVSSSKLASRMKLKNTAEFMERCLTAGYIAKDGDQLTLTANGVAAGGEAKHSKKFGRYFVWPANLAF